MPNRKYIDPHDPDLPKNIIAIEGYEWEDALRQIERAMRVAPVNCGNFMDLGLAPSFKINPSFAPQSDVGLLITNLMNGNFLNVDTQGFSSETPLRTGLSRTFGDVAAKADLDEDDRYLLKTVFDYIAAITVPLLDTWPGRTLVSLSFRGNDFAINNPSPMFSSGTNKENMFWSGLPFFGSTYHVRMSFNTLGQAIYDDDKIVKHKSHEYFNGGLDWHGDPKVKCEQDEIWHPKPWSITVLSSNLWPHRPVVSSSPRPMNFSGRQERRLTVSAVVQRL